MLCAVRLCYTEKSSIVFIVIIIRLVISPTSATLLDISSVKTGQKKNIRLVIF